jgi:uncharacterized protein YbjT (DUF2867 family)
VNEMTTPRISVVMLGATGAVGGEVVKTLLTMPQLDRLTLLGRRPAPQGSDPRLTQHTVDVSDPSTYAIHLQGHTAAVCTLGLGQPSKASREEFIRVDKTTVLSFGTACRHAAISHFELLGAAAADSRSNSFYLRVKGELEDGLAALRFPRTSFFRPSMILTPSNRYGLAQGILLTTWPWLHPLLVGPLRKFRGVRVEDLGAAMSRNLLTQGAGVEVLHWDEFNTRQISRAG